MTFGSWEKCDVINNLKRKINKTLFSRFVRKSPMTETQRSLIHYYQVDRFFCVTACRSLLKCKKCYSFKIF